MQTANDIVAFSACVFQCGRRKHRFRSSYFSIFVIHNVFPFAKGPLSRPQRLFADSAGLSCRELKPFAFITRRFRCECRKNPRYFQSRYFFKPRNKLPFGMSTLNMLFGKSGIKRFAVRVVCRLHKKTPAPFPQACSPHHSSFCQKYATSVLLSQ